MKVYVAGSCIFNGRSYSNAGLGVVFSDEHQTTISKPLDDSVPVKTNISSVMAAAIAALKTCLELGYMTVTVYTNVKYLVQLMKRKYFVHGCPNEELISALKCLKAQLHTVHFVHIPNITGDANIDTARRLAKAGAARDRDNNNVKFHPGPGQLVVYIGASCFNLGQPNAKAGFGAVFLDTNNTTISNPLDCALLKRTSNLALIIGAIAVLQKCEELGCRSVMVCTNSTYLADHLDRDRFGGYVYEELLIALGHLKGRMDCVKVAVILNSAGDPNTKKARNIAREGAKLDRGKEKLLNVLYPGIQDSLI